MVVAEVEDLVVEEVALVEDQQKLEEVEDTDTVKVVGILNNLPPSLAYSYV